MSSLLKKRLKHFWSPQNIHRNKFSSFVVKRKLKLLHGMAFNFNPPDIVFLLSKSFLREGNLLNKFPMIIKFNWACNCSTPFSGSEFCFQGKVLLRKFVPKRHLNKLIRKYLSHFLVCRLLRLQSAHIILRQVLREIKTSHEAISKLECCFEMRAKEKGQLISEHSHVLAVHVDARYALKN